MLMLMQCKSNYASLTPRVLHIGSLIVLDAPMVLLGDEAQVEAHFVSVGDSADLDAR